ncbi:hypothetical protein ACFL07_11705, partial [Pseudomonadota bacterium]
LARVEAAAPQDAHTQLYFAAAIATLGEHEKALEIAETWSEQRFHPGEPLWIGLLAAIYATVGEQERAMQYLYESRARHEMWMMFLDGPDFDTLRGNPRFAELVRELKLPEEYYLQIAHRPSS